KPLSTINRRDRSTETKPAPASGRERKDKAVLSLGAGETLILACLRAFQAECVRIISLLETPTTTPDQAAKHARPVGLRCAGRPGRCRRVRFGAHLVDARPGGQGV
ncbi:hypothetical protein THAOC_24895, partial [Thalassiosira oceanica]